MLNLAPPAVLWRRDRPRPREPRQAANGSAVAAHSLKRRPKQTLQRGRAFRRLDYCMQALDNESAKWRK
jgi:hypothetical protein